MWHARETLPHINSQTHRELEEDEALSLRLDERFGSSYDSTPEVELEEYDVSKLSKELNQLCAIPGMTVASSTDLLTLHLVPIMWGGLVKLIMCCDIPGH